MSTTDRSVRDANTAPGQLALYYVLAVVTLSLVVFRCWGRLRLTKDWGWDDTTIIIAWICFLVGLVFAQLNANAGMGRHSMYLTEDEINQSLMWNSFFQVADTQCALFTKISISIFILRIKDTRTIRWILAILMGFMSLATLQVLIVLCVACTPTRKLWTPSLPGKCVPFNSIFIMARVQSAFTVSTDLVLSASPIVILWNVRISVRRKIKICVLMSLGLFATLSNALRNIYQDTLYSPDFTYAIMPLFILAVLELAFGLIAACIPACVPFFNHYRSKLQTDTKAAPQISDAELIETSVNSLLKKPEVLVCQTTEREDLVLG